jgi:hypothetical protein
MKMSKGNTATGLRTLRGLLALGFALGSFATQAAPISGQGTWETTLQGRDASGNPVSLLSGAAVNPGVKYVYDTVLDLTWLANWDVNGRMNWDGAKVWAASLTDFGGGWALPTVLDIGTDGCNPAYSGTDCGRNVYGSEAARHVSPLAHMYYDTLGNLADFDAGASPQSGWGLTNTGPFSNMQSDAYWSGTAFAPSPADDAWVFVTVNGVQGFWAQNGDLISFAVAVRSGDVFAGSVPEPGGLGLLGFAFGTLAVVRRRRTH